MRTFFLAAGLAALAVGCGRPAGLARAEPRGEEPTPTRAVEAPRVPAAPPSARPVRAVLASVGDVLPHLMVKAAARARRTGPDNHEGYGPLVASLVPTLAAYDVASFNMEAPVVAAPLLPHAQMRFHADPAMPAALRAAGFDVAVCANNHAFDQGGAGLVESTRQLARAGLATAGCGASLAEASRPHVVEVRGLRIAILAFASVMNAHNPARRAHPEWAHVLFWHAGEPTGSEVLAAVRATRARDDVDVVVVNAHWDREYQPAPLESTRAIARALVDAGADLVVGHHPHVLEPAEWLTREGRPRAAVIYSLGNFISEMCANRAPLDLCDRRLSAIAVATFEKDAEGARLAELAFEPTWMDHRATCPGEESARTHCARPVVVRDELARIETELARVTDPARRARLERERQGFTLRADVIRRFMGPHGERGAPPDAYVGVDRRIVARSRHGAPRRGAR